MGNKVKDVAPLDLSCEGFIDICTLSRHRDGVWQVLGRRLSGVASKLFVKGDIHARREIVIISKVQKR